MTFIRELDRASGKKQAVSENHMTQVEAKLRPVSVGCCGDKVILGKTVCCRLVMVPQLASFCASFGRVQGKKGFKQGWQRKSKAHKLAGIGVSYRPPKSLDEMCGHCVPQRPTTFQGASGHRDGGRNLGTVLVLSDKVVEVIQ